MANTKSAEKRIRQDEKQRVRNRSYRSTLRTAIKNLRQSVSAGETENARGLLGPTLSLLDSTARKGVMHANTAARTKSRLTRAVNALA